MKTVIPWAGIEAAERSSRVKRAAEEISSELHARYPETAGYQYKVDDTRSPGNVFFRVIRGLNWGLSVGIVRTPEGAKLTVLAESKLTVILALSGFGMGFALTAWFLMLGAAFNLAFFVIGGFLLGGAIAAAVWFLMLPLQGVKAPVVEELLEKLAVCAARAIGGPGGN